jgi:site-specific recombinase XerD
MPLTAELYPNYQRGLLRELPGEADAFDLARERFLLGYGPETARAYWGDLEHWRDWCREQQPAVDPLSLTDRDLTNYVAGLARWGYAHSTVGRRRSTLTRFRRIVHDPSRT